MQQIRVLADDLRAAPYGRVSKADQKLGPSSVCRTRHEVNAYDP